MKLSSSSSSSSFNKPISSPSRVEKFPPPLMRFLRSNGGSRSRSGRRSSRLSSSSPMFVIRKKNVSSSTGIETTQTTHEPSSPKVSCMGKVHVHHHQRSSKSKSKSKQNPSIKTPKCSSSSSCSCRWIREALFCKCLKPKFPDWRRRCCLFFQFGYRRKNEIVEEESVKTESRRQFTVVKYEVNPREEEEDEDEEEEEKEERVFTSSSSSSTIPPKNALLLMRCRSDPCRNRFSGGFPTVTEEKPENRNKIEEVEEIPTLEKEPIFIDSASEWRIDNIEEKMGSCEGFENLNNGRKRENIKNGALVKVNGGFSSSSSSSRSLPLTLARCKSESETCYWNKRKNSGFDEKCPPLLL